MNERQEDIVRAAHNLEINEAEEDFLVYGAERNREWETHKVKRLFRRSSNRAGIKNLIWFKYHIPRYSFITWITWLNRLPTADRLSSWGMNVDESCVLCNLDNESRDHLFFECQFSSAVWREGVRRNCTLLNSENWQEIVGFMQQNSNSGGLRKLMMRLLWTATIYRLWAERNRRRHGERAETVNQVVRRITFDLQHKSLSFEKFIDNATNSLICENWGLPHSLLYRL